MRAANAARNGRQDVAGPSSARAAASICTLGTLLSLPAKSAASRLMSLPHCSKRAASIARGPACERLCEAKRALVRTAAKFFLDTSTAETVASIARRLVILRPSVPVELASHTTIKRVGTGAGNMPVLPLCDLQGLFQKSCVDVSRHCRVRLVRLKSHRFAKSAGSCALLPMVRIALASARKKFVSRLVAISAASISFAMVRHE